MKENKIFIYINMDLILDIIKDYKKECSEAIKDIYIKILIFLILLFILGLITSILYFKGFLNIKYIYLIIANLIIFSLSIWINYDTYKISKKYLVLYILSILSTIFYIIISVLAFKTISINNQILLTLFINLLLVLLFFFGSCDEIKHSCNIKSWPENQKGEDKKNEREDYCNKLNETCMDDMNKSEDECGICSDTNYNNKDDCLDNNKEWTSRYTKCFWSKPSDKKVTSCDITTDSPPLEFHEGSCVYDLDKCASINCNDFQPTSVFYDCCEENTRGWQENMDCNTLRTQIDANKTTEGRIGGGSQRAGELEAEYNLRVAASSQTSNRRRNGAPNPSQASSSRLNSENSARPSLGSNRPSKTNNIIEDAAFSSAEKPARRPSRRPAKNSGANPSNERRSSKSSYSSSTRKSRPRDNSSRFDD